MTVETKYKIGDKVWTKFGGVPFLCKIEDITMMEYKQYELIAYSVCSIDEKIVGTRFTNELFSTEEELLKSL